MAQREARGGGGAEEEATPSATPAGALEGASHELDGNDRSGAQMVMENADEPPLELGDLPPSVGVARELVGILGMLAAVVFDRHAVLGVRLIETRDEPPVRSPELVRELGLRKSPVHERQAQPRLPWELGTVTNAVEHGLQSRTPHHGRLGPQLLDGDQASPPRDQEVCCDGQLDGWEVGRRLYPGPNRVLDAKTPDPPEGGLSGRQPV